MKYLDDFNPVSHGHGDGVTDDYELVASQGGTNDDGEPDPPKQN